MNGLRFVSLTARHFAAETPAAIPTTPLGRAWGEAQALPAPGPEISRHLAAILGGTHGALKLNGADGAPCVWKSSDSIQTAGECGASQLASRITGGLVPVPVASDLAGTPGIVQPFLELRGNTPENRFDPSLLTPREAARLYVHLLADRAVSNLDTHDGHFGFSPAGDIVAIDKGQAFKFFREDGITSPYAGSVRESSGINPWNHWIPAFTGDKRPVYTEFFAAVLDGRVRLDVNDPVVEEALRRAETVTREELGLWLGGFASAVYPGREGRFLDAVLDRLQRLRGESEAFISDWDLRSALRRRPGETDPKIVLAQMTVIPHEPEKNFRGMETIVAKARRDGADIVVFPAQCLAGSQVGDRLENPRYATTVASYNDRLRELSRGIVLVWGNIVLDTGARGHDGNPLKRNAVFIARNGGWVSNGVFEGMSFQTIPADYRGFSDSRYFESMSDYSLRAGRSLSDLLRPFPVPIRGRLFRLGLTVTEDIWTENAPVVPAAILARNGADIIVNVTSSPWTERKDRKRRRIGEMTAAASGVPLIVVNDVGEQNVENNFYLHDGGSLVFSRDGAVHSELPAFADATRSMRFSDIGRSRIAAPDYGRERDVEQLCEAILYSAERFALPSLVPASGGVDSSVVLALAAIARGADEVIGLTMPGPHTGETLPFAMRLFDNLGVWRAAWPIGDAVDTVERGVAKLEFVSSAHPGAVRRYALDGQGLTHQNLQARERGNHAMTLAQMTGHGIIATNNKTEIAFGFGAIHGNWIGVKALLGDVPKGRQREDSPSPRIGVWDLARYLNRRFGHLSRNAGPLIPEEIILMPPTTELSDRAEQDFFFPYHDAMADAWLSFNVGGYELRDPEDFLAAYLKEELDEALGLPRGTILAHFGTPARFVADLEDKWARFYRTNFKQSVMPPIVVVSHRALGRDKRHSQGVEPYSEGYLELKRRVLGGSAQ